MTDTANSIDLKSMDDAGLLLGRMRVLMGRMQELAANHLGMSAEELAAEVQLLERPGGTPRTLVVGHVIVDMESHTAHLSAGGLARALSNEEADALALGMRDRKRVTVR